MDDKLSPLAKDRLVSSFINIAEGETMDRARQFLDEKNWCLEDALELYYTVNTDVVEHPRPLSDTYVVQSVVTNIAPAMKLQSGNLECSSVASTQRLGNLFSDQYEFFQRRKRHTHAQIVADALAGLSTPTSTEFVTCRKRCSVKMGKEPPTLSPVPFQINHDASRYNPRDTHETCGLIDEMCRDASSLPSTSGSVNRLGDRTPHIEITATNLQNVAPAPNFVQRRRRRTRAEIVSDNLTGNSSIGSQELVFCRRRRSKLEISKDASGSPLESIDSTSGYVSTCRDKSPCIEVDNETPIVGGCQRKKRTRLEVFTITVLNIYFFALCFV